MSINIARKQKAFFTDSKKFIGDCDSSSMSVKCSSHFKHINSVGFFEFQEWYKAFTEIGKKISCKFRTIKKIARSFSAINDFDSSEFSNEIIDKSFINAMDLKLKHILRVIIFSFFSSFRDKKATITINKTCKIDKIISSKFMGIKKLSSFTHINLQCFGCSVIVAKSLIKVHRDRLSEWTPLGDAIVGPA